MTEGTLKNVKIAGIATAVPTKEVSCEDYFEKFGEKNVKKFVKMTGVKKRFISGEKQTSSDLAVSAAERLLTELKWDRSSIDGIIYVTQTPDYIIPATACVIHKRLGLEKDCMAFDVNLGCSGYVYGLHMAALYLQCENINRMLLVVGDTSSAFISEDDKSSAMLFGEAGSATALEKDAKSKPMHFKFRTDGEGFQAIIVPSGAYRNPDGKKERYEFEEGIIRSDFELYMNGTAVFNFTIEEVPKIITEFKEKFSMDNDNIDYYVMHQANLFMLKTIASRSDIPLEKMPISIDRFGNTSVTSIPLTLCDLCGNENDDKELNIVSCGFGIGLSWGVVSFNINQKNCFPIFHTDDYFTGGELIAND